MMRMLMKMAAASTISLLLLCCFAISRTDSKDNCNYNAVKGKDFIVPLSLKLEPSHRLKWKHDDSVILEQRQNSFIRGKKDDVSENGSLKLTNLNYRHNGIYTPELFNQDGSVIGNPEIIHLCILEPAPKPKVTKDCSLTDVIFTCVVPAELAKNLSFAWLQNDKDTKAYTKSLTRNAEQVEKDSFKCKVSNPASDETSDAVTQECYNGKFIFPEKLFGISTWIYVGAGGGIVLVLIIVVIICCVRGKRKKQMLLMEEGELRLQWTNEQQHPHPHHHHHHQQHQHQHNHPPEPHHHRSQQQPAGHTGPRQHRSKQHREQQQLPRAPPEPSSRRPPQAPRAVDQIDDEQPPPLPQPRKKAAKTPRV